MCKFVLRLSWTLMYMNNNQHDALFIFSSLSYHTSTCFESISSPSSGGRMYFIHLLSLARSRGFVITHNDAPHSVGLLCTSDQLLTETSTWQHTTHTKENIHAPGRIRTHDRSRRAALDRTATGTGEVECIYICGKWYLLYFWADCHGAWPGLLTVNSEV
jgi:hypothetical protein